MITTAGSANIHFPIEIKKENNFLLVMRTHRIYSFNYFPIYHSAVSAIYGNNVVSYIPSTYFVTGNLYILATWYLSFLV